MNKADRKYWISQNNDLISELKQYVGDDCISIKEKQYIKGDKK